MRQALVAIAALIAMQGCYQERVAANSYDMCWLELQMQISHTIVRRGNVGPLLKSETPADLRVLLDRARALFMQMQADGHIVDVELSIPEGLESNHKAGGNSVAGSARDMRSIHVRSAIAEYLQLHGVYLYEFPAQSGINRGSMEITVRHDLVERANEIGNRKIHELLKAAETVQ